MIKFLERIFYMATNFFKSRNFKIGSFVLALALIGASLSNFSFFKANAETKAPAISNNYLRGVQENWSCKNLKEAYSPDLHGLDYELYDVEGNRIGSSNVAHKVSTGDYIKDSKNNIYKVVVTGDIDSDGRISITDTAALKMHFAGTITLKDELLQAADSEPNGYVNATDYLRFKFHIQKIYNIYTNEYHVPDEPSSDDVSQKYDESNWTSGWM
jgi:hypothetical protein